MRTRNRPLAALFLCACLILPGGSAQSYNISLKGRVHERLTRLAELCLERSAGRIPVDCDVGNIPAGRTMHGWRNDLTLSSRWADDPTRQLSGLTGIKFVISAGRTCRNWFRGDRDEADAPFGGILCGSHYGPLQFWHAMRSSEAESPAETRAKILEWVDVAYRVATGRISENEAYCSYFSERPALARAMVPENFPYCSDRPGSENDGRGFRAWRVLTLFSMRCSNPVSSRICTEIVGSPGTALARRNARGALLHIVQDSFSQSHAVRGGVAAGRQFSARIVCLPVTSFNFYTGQVTSGVDHGSADKYPTVDGTTCGPGRQVDDPVTASAVLLWHVNANSDPEIVQAYFRDRVLGAGS